MKKNIFFKQGLASVVQKRGALAVRLAHLHEMEKFEKFRVRKSRSGNIGPDMSGPEQLVRICRWTIWRLCASSLYAMKGIYFIFLSLVFI
jgi:hypothetical protein